MHIALAGINGAGKSSATAAIVSQLEAAGLSVVQTREPGGTELGAKIRELFLHGEQMSATTEALLMYADRVHHVERVVAPALERFNAVVSDRSLFCTAAFQMASGLPVSQLEALEQMIAPEHWPSHALLFDIDAKLALERIAQQRGLDRVEAKALAYHEKVRSNYLLLAKRYAHLFTVIDASQSMERVAEQVQDAVGHILCSGIGRAMKAVAGG